MSFKSFLLRRLLSSLVVLICASIIIFSMVRLVPGNPAVLMLGGDANPEQVAQLERELGLHLPIWEQYLTWIASIVTLDLGQSLIFREDITHLLAVRYPRSLQLALMSMVIATVAGILLGVVGAFNRNSKKDYFSLFFSQFGMSIPAFWLGILLVLVFSRLLGILPPSGHVAITEDPVENLRRTIMPAVAMATINAAVITRYVRAELLDVLNENYVRTAHAYGINKTKIKYLYVLKNGLIPAVTIIGLQFGAMFAGVVVIEEVFAYPGIGQLLVDALQQRDYPVVQMVLLVLAITFILINFIVDITYGYLDPKMKVD